MPGAGLILEQWRRAEVHNWQLRGPALQPAGIERDVGTHDYGQGHDAHLDACKGWQEQGADQGEPSNQLYDHDEDVYR